jgi:hypothetical protein
METIESENRALSRRKAVAARLAHSNNRGILWIGDRQFRGDQHGLVKFIRRGKSNVDISRVLTIMEGDDSLKPMVGVERPLAFEATLIGLDTHTKDESRIDAAVTDNGVKHSRNSVLRFATSEIDGVVATPTGRQKSVER